MADNVHRRGFRFVSSLSGKPPRIQRMRVASGYSGTPTGGNCDINVGDVVERLATGYVAHAAAGNTDNWGVVVGIAPYYDGTSMRFGSSLPYNTTYGTVFERESNVFVIPGLGNIFEVDCDDAVTATTYAAYLALIGENCDHAYLAGSEPQTDIMLDISDHKSGTANWRIQDISPTLENADFSGAYVKLLVTLNEGSEPPYSTSGI